MMRIRISYKFHAEDDYSLKNPDKFGCKEIKDEFYNYVGLMEFEDEDITTCKTNATMFLKQLLCDGIQVSSDHYLLMKYFYDAIERSIAFIIENDDSYCCIKLPNNYYDKANITIEIDRKSMYLIEKVSVLCTANGAYINTDTSIVGIFEGTENEVLELLKKRNSAESLYPGPDNIYYPYYTRKLVKIIKE